MTVHGNEVMCDAEGCSATGTIPLGPRDYDLPAVQVKGWTTAVVTTTGNVTHFCPDHSKKFHG
jgi:hypothetical protein